MKEARVPLCRIKILTGNEIREELVEKTAFTIGRGRDADIQIASPNISRVHLSVEIRASACWVSDFGSANGSFINNKEIARHQAIQYKPGDTIRLGESKEIIILEPLAPRVEVAQPAEINLDETKPKSTLAVPSLPDYLHPPPQQSAVIDHSAVERILNQAKALAAQLREAAELETKKQLSDSLSAANRRTEDAQIEALKTISDAQTQASLISKVAQSESLKVISDAKSEARKLQNETQTEAKKSIADAQSEANKLVADAQAEAKRVLLDARTTSSDILTLAKQKAIETQRTAEENTKDSVAEIYRKAIAEGDKILLEFKPRGEKLVTDARVAATAIKNAAQEEADTHLNETYQKCNKMTAEAEESVSIIDKEAKQKAELILKESQNEVDRIIQDTKEISRKLRQKNEQEFLEIRLEAEKKAQQRLDQAKVECDKIISHANSVGEGQKKSIISRAETEAKDILLEGNRKAKLAAQEITRGFQDEHVQLSQTRESLEREVARFEQQKLEAEKNYSRAHEELSSANVKLDEVQSHLRETEVATKKRTAELQSQVTKLDEAIAIKSKAVADLDASTIEITTRSRQEEENTLKFQKEALGLETKIAELMSQESHLNVRLITLDKHIEQERTRLKESLDAEIGALKKEMTIEVKKMREQANVDHAKARASQDSELLNLKNRELDLIKSLRAEADAKAKLARKHQAIEMARALEIYLTPKLQSALKLQELPSATFQTFFQDITAVVSNLMVDESASGSDQHSMQSASTPGVTIAEKKKRQRVFAAVASVVILGLGSLFYYQEKYGDHRSVSELFADELRDKEAKKPKFTPAITSEFKHSYTDNVIYTESYAQFKLDAQLQSRWIRDLNKFLINHLNLNENSVVKFIPLETDLLNQLQEKRKIIHFETQESDINTMREIEVTSVEKLKEVLGGESNYKAFREFEKNYFQQNRMPASK